MSGTKTVNITFSCGHRLSIAGVDDSVRVWKEKHAMELCYDCKPTQKIERLCGHTEEVARGFFSPRAHETSAMQLCTTCNEYATKRPIWPTYPDGTPFKPWIDGPDE